MSLHLYKNYQASKMLPATICTLKGNQAAKKRVKNEEFISCGENGSGDTHQQALILWRKNYRQLQIGNSRDNCATWPRWVEYEVNVGDHLSFSSTRAANIDVEIAGFRAHDSHNEIEAILDHRFDKQDLTYYEYFIKWEGYSSKYNKWTPSNNFDSQEIIQEYWESLG